MSLVERFSCMHVIEKGLNLIFVRFEWEKEGNFE